MFFFSTWWITLIPDVDKSKSLERVEHEFDPFREAGEFKAVERFAEGEIPNQVEGSPDVPFEHVDCFCA